MSDNWQATLSPLGTEIFPHEPRPSLTVVNITQPIPVLTSTRQDVPLSESNNNCPPKLPAVACKFCVGGSFQQEEQYYQHLKLDHYEALFKCSVCRLGFEAASDAVKHQRKHHGGGGRVVWPGRSELLLAARCKVRDCKRELVAVTGAQVEEHFVLEHGLSSAKATLRRQQGVEWRCRVCTNIGRRLCGETAALAHAATHGKWEEVDESDTSSGGFSSVSSLDSSVDSSESERGTELSEEGGGGKIGSP